MYDLLLLLSAIDPSILSGEEAKDIFLPDIQGWDKEFAYEDKYVKEQLGQDLTMAFTYRNGSKVMYVSIQISKNLHLWEDSLLYEPERSNKPKAEVIEYREVTINQALKGRWFVFIRPNSTMEEAVLYWLENSKFKIGSSIEDRFVLISLWNYPKVLREQGFDNIEEVYLSFAKSIALHWRDLKTNSSSNYLILLVIITIAASIIIFILYRRRAIKEL